MNTFLEFISHKNSFKHHALLLLSNYFSSNTIPANEFKHFVYEFCGIILYESKEASCFEIASQHPDIFIADRERKILRLEDIKQIRDFILYPPQQATKRLFFIENCERLNNNAANSLLKVLEEPSTASLFLLTSSKISLVMPTIASRVQKITVSFTEEKPISASEGFSAEDVEWVQKQIDKFNLKNYLPHTSLNEVSLSQDKSKSFGIISKYTAEIITRCEKLAKEHQAEELRALFVSLINEKLKRDLTFINTAKLFLSHLSEWRDFQDYNPSTSLWLIRIFLLFTL